MVNKERFERLADLFVTQDKSFDQLCDDQGKAWWDLKSSKTVSTTKSAAIFNQLDHYHLIILTQWLKESAHGAGGTDICMERGCRAKKYRK
jgi:hypothetical protein